jgi:hypothetical protein
MNRITISHITISLAIGTALVMGALMYGATKPSANQAFAAAAPCNITLAFNAGNPQHSFINGNLKCGGQGVGGATIHLTLHGTTTGSTNKVDVQTESGSGDFDRAVTLVPGHSYTVTAKYDGDINQHLQPASATASINIPGSTGSTQNSSNAGNGQGTSNAGSTQQNNNTQASASPQVPCSLTVGPTPNEDPISSVEGKLICGGLGEPRATIQISGLPGGSASTTTANDGKYELGVFSPFSPGQSYTVTAKYDGDINQHLQPASATTIINIPGSTGSTPQNSNAGSTQDTSNAGSTQDTSNAGSTQDTSNAGSTQDTSNAGNSAG